ncbi:MAG: HD domain-containing protein [Actinomycetia bacterium]|nr:HD domain-containing protein [Actinomycetes bacterium]
MDRELRRVMKREGQLDLLAYIVILVLIALTGVLLFLALARIELPDAWLLRNEILRTIVPGLLLMVILYLIDQHGRLRRKLISIHEDLETAKSEIQSAYDRLAFAHRTAELMASLTEENGVDHVLEESVAYFGADAAAVVGDDVRMFASENVPRNDAQRAIMQTALDAVRAGQPIAAQASDSGSAALAVPLRVKGHLDRVCCLWRREGAFTEEQLEGLQLVARILEMNLENRVLLDEIRSQLQGTLMALSNLVELRQPDYIDHSTQVADLSVSVGVELGLDSDAIADLKLAAVLHDVGMLEVPLEILSARRMLTAEEELLVKRHPSAGARIVRTARFNDEVQQAVLAHHERVDGSGYPHGLRGDQIPLLARIIAVCDSYHAMISNRPHRPALTQMAAIAELRGALNRAYDPRVVQALQTVTGHGDATSSPADVALLLEQVS